jgi:uncharacterized coiled-coil protein SlyX
MSVVSNNGDDLNGLSVKLNRLEHKVSKLSDTIKENKQVISDLKLVISQRDVQIKELEMKLGYAQQSLLEKAVNKIQECRVHIKTDMDAKLINPTLDQIQRHIKAAQEFVDEAKTILLEKKALVDSTILTTKNRVVECPGLAKTYVENSIIVPAQAMINQTLESIGIQAKTTRNLVEDKAIYPSKVWIDDVVAKAQNLPEKAKSQFQAQVLDLLADANKKATSVVNNIYPDTMDYIYKTTACLNDIVNKALLEIFDQIKRSPFWDGKNNITAAN